MNVRLNHARLAKLRTIGLSLGVMIGLAASGLHAALAAEPMAVPGTSVTMTPPDGFVVARDFAGFMSKEKQGSFLIAEMPAKALAQLSPLFADQDLAAQSFATKGITITEHNEIETDDGQTVPLLHGTQAANGIVFDKWMALYGGEKTILISFQIPHANALGEDTMKAVFASVSAKAPPTIDDKLVALPFEIKAAKPFRVVDVFAGNSVAMMAGDKDVDPDGLQPMVVASVSLASGDMSDLRAAAERSLRATVGLERAEITTKKETIFAEMSGYILRGTYDDKGTKKTFVQYIGAQNGRTFRLIGMIVTDEAEELEGTIDKIAASVRFKD